jgi:hypothetical protein
MVGEGRLVEHGVEYIREDTAVNQQHRLTAAAHAILERASLNRDAIER